MLSVREGIGVAAVVAGAAALAAVNHHPTHGRRLERERAVVRAAAAQLTHDQVSDAWTQARLGATAALSAIAGAIDLPHLSTHEEGDAIVVTFDGHGDHCVDLVSRPDANRVRTRRC